MAESSKPELVMVAQIGAVHGIQGEFKLLSFMDEAVSVLEYSPLLSDAGKPALHITAAREHKGQLLVRAKEAPDRTAAEKLTGLKLYIERAELPVLDDADDYYITDLIGLEVIDTGGHPIGKIINVDNFGAGDLLDVRPVEGANFYVPFTLENVPEVRLTEGWVVVDLTGL